ncbi:hypothetical protein D3C87_1904140 [compost metagenome]
MLASLKPLASPKISMAMMAMLKMLVDAIKNRNGAPSVNPIMRMYSRPRLFLRVHLSANMPPTITPIKEPIWMYPVAEIPASPRLSWK